MTQHSYRERDYAFGRAMLTQRMSIGLWTRPGSRPSEPSPPW